MIGIRGTAPDWLRSYSSDRYQIPCVHDVSSSNRKVSHGVPQYSVPRTVTRTVYRIYSHFTLNANAQLKNKKSQKLSMTRENQLSVLVIVAASLVEQ